MLLLLAVLTTLLIAFQFKGVQTWAAKKAAKYLSEQLHTTVNIGGLYVRPFSQVEIENLYVLDQQHDTLLNAPLLRVQLLDFSPLSSISKRQLVFKQITFNNGSVYLKKLADSTINFRFIINYFSSPDTTKSTSAPWQISFKTININNLRFRYKNYLNHDVVHHEVNFNDVDVKNFSVMLHNPDFDQHLFKADINNLTFTEKSGFYLKNLTANATVDSNQIELKHLLLQTRLTTLRDYYRMRFKNFDAFDDFEHKVEMEANFKQARISSVDVGFFAQAVQTIFFDCGLNGRIKGKLENLQARKFTITSGQATYIKGDFNMVGLPNWDKTIMDFNFEQALTNKKDIERIIGRITNNKHFSLPAIVGKFGNINFSGKFTGLQNDFVAYGDFKTSLGRLNTDIGMKISKNGQPSYNGKVHAVDFDLGALTDEPMLGRTTFDADLNGNSFELNRLTEQLQANFKTFTFNGYTYNNVMVNGSFLKKKFDGTVQVNDPNLNLQFAGAVDLNQTSPLFNFNAQINNAQLNKLNFLADTVKLDAKVSSNFNGNSINNIVGNIKLNNIGLQSPKYHYHIDSVMFAATNTAQQRKLILRSDLADGTLTGNYNLAALPDYFKSVIKNYIPSVRFQVPALPAQNFEVNIKLKNLNPITSLFAPGLNIPERGEINGQFNTEAQTATINGLIKTIKYNGIVFHDLLIDETTAKDVMNINLALSKINFSDSVYIKDINIANFLKRDTLNFNIKLSDKNATDQLDLYGLIPFNNDSTRQIKLLPSDVVIEKKTWRLAEEVEVLLMPHNRIGVKGFELSREAQKVKMQGVISADSTDALSLRFEKFSLSTFNQLTKGEGLLLNGSLNGDINMVGILDKPGLSADLKIDSMALNRTRIGTLHLKSNYDNANKLATVNLNILNRGLETLNAEGSYHFANTGNNLDFHIGMNQTEAVILEPFVNSLVSNLSGTLSADVNLTGTFSKPLLNGNVTLANTGLTVNYLKTPYLLNEKADIENSVINLTDLKITDGRGGKGIANGSIDLRDDITNPILNIDIVADKLLALNTAFKDNRLYYGVAYGTGSISFTGPTDNLRIDIDAKTNEGTVFNIPLNTSTTATDYDFIRFVNPADSVRNKVTSNLFKGITLNFNLSADEKTTVKIYTDYGLLTGNGVANGLTLSINSLGDFDMRGGFTISTGKFEFTSNNFISKNFEVSPGGTIKWTGSPFNAEISMNALYEVRTSVKDLYTAAGLQFQSGNPVKRVQAQMKLTHSLIQPTIDFDFNFPDDATIKDDIGTYLNDNTNRSQQALSLIVRRNFAPGTGTNTLSNQVTQTAEEVATELAFNKINNFISQQNIKNLDFNIRSLSEASASLHLFNDRLSLNTSLFNNQQTSTLATAGNTQTFFNSNLNSFTKDFEAQYLINKEGGLLANYSYRVLNSNTLNTINNDQINTQYVNGLGLIYHKDFDTFGEFLRNTFTRNNKSRTNTKADTAKKTDTLKRRK